MKKELIALKDNHTWDLKNLLAKPLVPNGSTRLNLNLMVVLIGLKEDQWRRVIIKQKRDYFDSFSPVAKLVTIKLFLAITVAKSQPIHQLDINNAFLHGYLEEEVYMQPPEGYTKAILGQIGKLK